VNYLFEGEYANFPVMFICLKAAGWLKDEKILVDKRRLPADLEGYGAG